MSERSRCILWDNHSSSNRYSFTTSRPVCTCRPLSSTLNRSYDPFCVQTFPLLGVTLKIFFKIHLNLQIMSCVCVFLVFIEDSLKDIRNGNFKKRKRKKPFVLCCFVEDNGTYDYYLLTTIPLRLKLWQRTPEVYLSDKIEDVYSKCFTFG